MSDDFIAVATKEVSGDIQELENILKFCSTDDDVFENSQKFQKHTHKIKGLAPMMGKESLGVLSSSLDRIFKNMIEGEKHYGAIFDVLSDAISQMRKLMDEPDFDLSQINDKIKQL